MLVVALLVAQTRIESGVHSALEVVYGGLLGARVTLVVFQLFFDDADDDATGELYERTLEITERAYAPYSRFLVGAVVRARDGRSSTASTSRTPPTRSASARRRPRYVDGGHGRATSPATSS